MSLFGKILTILNALAAIAFFIIAGMDYRARQSWAFSAFRHELAIKGLPLDNTDDSWRPGRPIVKDLKTDVLKTMFAPVGGQPVTTQLEAVEQAKESALQDIESVVQQGGEQKARDRAAAIYLNLMKFGHERDQWVSEFNKPSNTMEAVKGTVADQFNQVANFIKSDATPEAKRIRVADLLYGFSSIGDANLRERAQIVVGLSEFVRAADRQASNLFAASLRLDQILKEDSAIFARQYQELIPQLEVLNEQLKADIARLDQQKKIFDQHNVLYQARKAERDELQERLRQETEKVATETAALANLQRQLFALQRQIADARAGNEKLESQIRIKELGQ